MSSLQGAPAPWRTNAHPSVRPAGREVAPSRALTAAARKADSDPPSRRRRPLRSRP